ncbi:MAG: Fe(3+) ABC transporter substrate-binding protein [Rhodospirillales bacterium]
MPRKRRLNIAGLIPVKLAAVIPVRLAAAGAAGVLALAALALPFMVPSAGAPARAEGGEVNLYSHRQPFLIKPLLDAFTAETGAAVNVVYAPKGMLERLKAEGAATPADAVLTVDIGRLHDLAEADLLQGVHSEILGANIPAAYRHPEGKWFGLTQRARVFMVSKDRVKEGEIKTYADLADPKFRGRVCIRSGKNLYNISLIASRIAHEGEAAARKWLAGVRDNLARKPQGNDRAQAKAVYEGLCDIAVANTYYMGKMAANDEKPEQKKWAEAVRMVFPDAQGRGTHINISGAAVTKHAKNKAGAVRLIEFLSGARAQSIYAETNFEYPVKPGAALHPMVASWGVLKPDPAALDDIARHRAAASRLVDETGFENGPGS